MIAATLSYKLQHQLLLLLLLLLLLIFIIDIPSYIVAAQSNDNLVSFVVLFNPTLLAPIIKPFILLQTKLKTYSTSYRYHPSAFL